MDNNIKIERICCPNNHYTFRVKKIKKWVEAVCEGWTLNLFAGMTELDIPFEIRNDIDITVPANYHMDAYEYVAACYDSFNTILLDPPYSERKSMEYYQGKKVSMFTKILDFLPGLLNERGIVITFGYQSAIMGRKRGFEVERICLFYHGGAIHDTIATIERKVNEYF